MTATALVSQTPTFLPAALERYAERARDYAQNARAESTRRAYRADMADFAGWCAQHALEPLPAAPQTLALYLADLADRAKIATLQRRLSAIAVAHREAGYDSPTTHPAVRTIWQGIRRTVRIAPTKKAALSIADLRAMIGTLRENLLGDRDRAILLVGFAGGFRRSELVALDVADIAFENEGVVVTIRRSKTDQEGAGRIIGIPRGRNDVTCPVRALERWLEKSQIAEGPLFRAIDRHGNIASDRLSDRAVALIVQRAAHAAGLDARQFAGHSLRAGFATTAASTGASERAIMAQTGHRSEKVLRGYIRRGSVWADNAAKELGL